MNKRKLMIVLISCVALVAASGGIAMLLMMFKKAPMKQHQKETILFVKAQPVRYGKIESQVEGAGRLASQQHVDVIAEVQGKIIPGDIPLKKGQTFKKGDRLCRIFDQEAGLALQAKKSRFLNAVANLLPDFKVDFPQSHPKWTQFMAVMDMNKDLPPLPETTSAKEKIFLAGRNILSDYYSIKSDEVRLDKYTIYAPFSGTFTSVLLEAGSVANPGSRLAEIIRTDSLELEVPIEIHNADWITNGAAVTVTNDDGSKEWQGKVVRKANFVEANTQALSVFVGIDSTQENPLYLGMYLKAIFQGVVVENAMEIPRNAVFNSNEVYAIIEGRLKKRQIKIHKIDANTLIFSGLTEGTEIVVEPLINASENTAVQILGKEKETENTATGDPKEKGGNIAANQDNNAE